MSRSVVYPVSVEFGDCDPAGIVFYPNFFRWFDAASRHFFTECGVPPWRETAKTNGVIGTPLLDVSCRFVKSATYGDRVGIETRIEQWNEKTFVQLHRMLRDGELLAECRELRVFAARHPDDERRIRAIPCPAEIRALCD